MKQIIITLALTIAGFGSSSIAHADYHTWMSEYVDFIDAEYEDSGDMCDMSESTDNQLMASWHVRNCH